MRIKRYQWEDALIEAERLHLLPAGAVNMALRLASAITWEPKGGKPSGLYWKNETALRSVNSSRATYFRYRKSLFETGFLSEEKGNLIPQVPKLSQIETDESQIETDESQIDTPYSVDTYTVDEFTVSEAAAVVAGAPTTTALPNSEVKEGYEYIGSLNLEDFEDFSNSKETLAILANSKGIAAVEDLPNPQVEDTRQSQIETPRPSSVYSTEQELRNRRAKILGRAS